MSFAEELSDIEDGLGAVQGDVHNPCNMIRLLLDTRHHSQTCHLGTEDVMTSELIEELWSKAKQRTEQSD